MTTPDGGGPLPAGQAARPGEVIAVDRSRLLPAGCHFNPSLVWWEGRLWMVYRRVTPDPAVDVVAWPRELALCRLGSDLQPIASSNVDLSARIEDPPGARRWHADARFFLRDDGPWLSYHDNHDLFVMPLDPERLPARLRPLPLTLVERKRRERERNWGWFDDGDFKAVYTIDPHVVVGLSASRTGFEARVSHQTTSAIPWDRERWGEPHGGTAPIRVGDCWFSFFQSSALVRPGSEQKTYVVGFYGFDARPPHRIRCMSRRPLLDGSELAGPLSFWNDYAVAYPSGAVFHDGRWMVSIGIHDRTLGLVVFDHQELLAGAAEN
jgi:predicted GH43/DUF377 family glycosyl hydrolase